MTDIDLAQYEAMEEAQNKKEETHTPQIYIENSQGIQPLIRNSQIDLASMDFGDRYELLEKQFPRDKFNIVQWDENILCHIPAGAYLVPGLVRPSLDDCWHGETAKKIGLKEGQIEPRAEFYNKLGQNAGVKLKLFSRDVIDLNGVAFYEILYIAYALMPWGVMQTEPVGKAQPLYNQNGVAAHIIENTDKKARRNAYKAFLNLQTTYDQARFLKPWIPAQFAYKAGQSQEVDRLIAEQAERANYAKEMLFPTRQNTRLISAGMTEAYFNEIKDKITDVKSKEDLQKIVDMIGQGNPTDQQRRVLIPLYKDKKRELEAKPVDANAN